MHMCIYGIGIVVKSLMMFVVAKAFFILLERNNIYVQMNEFKY